MTWLAAWTVLGAGVTCALAWLAACSRAGRGLGLCPVRCADNCPHGPVHCSEAHRLVRSHRPRRCDGSRRP